MQNNSLTNQQRKQVQRMMSEPGWDAIEAFTRNFLLRHFAQASIKRETEFDTVWFLARSEGGKEFIQLFMRELEEEASLANAQ